MKLIYTTVISIVLFLNTIYATSQVTIGSGNSPASGMLLQIKDTEPDITQISIPFDLENITSKTGGITLPCIRLKAENDISPIILSDDLPDADAKTELEGLMVFNINEDDNLCLGLYVWGGTKWDILKEIDSSVKKLVDSRDGEVYQYKAFDLAGEWLIENIRYTNNGTLGKYPNNDAGVSNKYGLLYSWSEATAGKVTSADEGNNALETRIEGICPTGWHLPSDYEWSLLEKVIADEKTIVL